LSGLAKADSLTITYNGDQNQTVVAQNSTFATAIFAGYITNNTDHAITFQLSGGPVPFEPYLAFFISGISYPGITLGAGMSTGIIQLAVVHVNPFGRSSMYPGLVTIVLPAIDKTGMILSGADGNTATLRVVTPEPSTLVLCVDHVNRSVYVEVEGDKRSSLYCLVFWLSSIFSPAFNLPITIPPPQSFLFVNEIYCWAPAPRGYGRIAAGVHHTLDGRCECPEASSKLWNFCFADNALQTQCFDTN
jgi:hypothetical protein